MQAMDSSRSRLMSILDEISIRYESLSRIVDERIQYLNEMESVIEAQIMGTIEMDDVYFDDEEESKEEDLTRGRRVRFDDVVVEIPDHIEVEPEDDSVSVDTIPFNRFMSGYDDGYDSDSDNDTVVEEWSDPARTPTYRDILHADEL